MQTQKEKDWAKKIEEFIQYAREDGIVIEPNIIAKGMNAQSVLVVREFTDTEKLRMLEKQIAEDEKKNKKKSKQAS